MKRSGERTLPENGRKRCSSQQCLWPYEIVNEVDSCPFPAVEYIDRSVAGPGVGLSVTESLYPGCSCVGICADIDEFAEEKTCSCFRKHGPVCNKEGRLCRPEDEKRPLMECSGMCKCSKQCPNRLVQRNASGNVPLQIFRTQNKGWGVRLLVAIQQWTFVCEYAGHVIRWEAARQRELRRHAGKPSYLVVLKEHTSEGRILRTHVDASACGNAARFINHSCDPNLIMVAVRCGHLVPRLALFACRDIKAGEELTFSYGDCDTTPQSEDKPPFTAKTKTQDISEDKRPSTEPMQVVCLCGSPRCKGFLPFDRDLF